MKKCGECLHSKVCKIRIDHVELSDKLYKEVCVDDRLLRLHFQGFAEKCKSYLVYEEGSIEDFISGIKDARRTFEWCSAMAKSEIEGKDSAIVEYSKKEDKEWLDNYHRILRKGFDVLNRLLETQE